MFCMGHYQSCWKQKTTDSFLPLVPSEGVRGHLCALWEAHFLRTQSGVLKSSWPDHAKLTPGCDAHALQFVALRERVSVYRLQASRET